MQSLTKAEVKNVDGGMWILGSSGFWASNLGNLIKAGAGIGAGYYIGSEIIYE